MELTALTETELGACAEALGAILRSGDVVLLDGPMGAGKTTMTRALARGLGVDRPDRVRSPTFNICLVHEGPVPLWHVDLFRLGELAESEDARVGTGAFEALGLEALADRMPSGGGDDGVLVIEWASLWAHPLEAYLQVDLRMSTELGKRDLRARAVGAEPGRRLCAWAARASGGL